MTNAHVVIAGRRTAREVYVELSDRNRVAAKVLGTDPSADLALLEIDPDGLDLRPLQLGRMQGLAPGQPVAAIGSPFGQEQSLSTGVISALDRSVSSLTDFEIPGAIQTDAAINRGNSGGPLLDARGRVIGVNQQIRTSSGGGEGVGFAVPVDLVRRSLRRLRAGKRVPYAFLGVSTQALYPQLARKLGLDVRAGGLVARVAEGGPADRAGIRGGTRALRFQGQPVRAGGDVVVTFDGEPVREESDLPRLVARREPGERVRVEVVRDGERRTVQVRLGRRPSSAPTELRRR